MKRTVQIAVIAAALVGGVGVPLLPASAADTSSISGVIFQDTNRNGAQDAGEAPYQGHTIYVADTAGNYVSQGTSDSSGRYTVAGLSAGTYQLSYESTAWWGLQKDWVPTTTGSIRPRMTVSVSGAARADFGWRRIVRSTTTGSPITAYTGSNGLRVESYNDAVTAREIYDAVMRGNVGAEAPYVTVRFDLGGSASTSSSVSGDAGTYSNYRAVSTNAWATWLDGDWGVSHEYGHAWTNYYDTIVQQEGGFGEYLRLRGIAGDSRLGSSHAWEPGELIAEDYRQLLGSPSAQLVAQENRELPVAKDVPGLAEYLSETFTSSPASAPPASPSPSPSPSASPSASPSTATVTAPVVNPTVVTKTASITSNLSAPATVTLSVRTSAGALVKTLLSSSSRTAGQVSASWDRKDDAGRRVAAGSYTVVIQAASNGTTTSASSPFSVK